MSYLPSAVNAYLDRATVSALAVSGCGVRASVARLRLPVGRLARSLYTVYLEFYHILVKS